MIGSNTEVLNALEKKKTQQQDNLLMQKSEESFLDQNKQMPVMGENSGMMTKEEEYNLKLEEIKANMPVDYSSSRTLLSDESRLFHVNSSRMQKVKEAISALESRLDTQGDREYEIKDIDEILKFYERAINACNAYVNNRKHNERWKKVNGNLERLAKEAAVWDKGRRLLDAGKVNSEAKSLRDLMETFRNTEEEVQPEKKVEYIEGREYVFKISAKFKFGKGSVYGKSTKLTSEMKEDIASRIPEDLSGFDRETKEAFELIKKWCDCDILKCRKTKEKREQRENEATYIRELYSKIEDLKNSDNETLKDIALSLDTMMKGKLEVDRNANDVVDLSDTLEDNYKEKFWGSKMRKGWDVDLKDNSDEPLFPHEPNISDIKQNDLGDCYFLSGLTTILETDPELIKQNMKDLGDSVAVRFNNFNNPRTVIVKKTSVVRRARNAYLGATESPLWVRMMEKAYAAVLAGYVQGCDGNQRIAALNTMNKQDARLNHKHVLAEFSLIREGNPYNALDVGGRHDDFISMFTGRKMNSNRSLESFHVKAVSVSKIAEQAREDMKKDKVRTETARLCSYYDKKILDMINLRFTRNKVKSWSEYADALDVVKKALEAGKISLDDYPDPAMEQEEKTKAFLDYIKNLRTYSKRNRKILQVDHSLVGEGAYDEKELAVFKELEDAEHEGKMVSVITRHSHKFLKLKENDRKKTEKDSGGFFSSHEYAFMGTRRLNENGVDRLFIILRNPWGDSIRNYDSSGRAKLLRNTTEEQEELKMREYEGQQYNSVYEHMDTNGVFHMELRDFLNMGERYRIEK